MSKLFHLLFLISVTTVCLTAQTNNKGLALNADEIISVQMKKVNPKNKTLQRELFLNTKQISDVATKWNSSKPDSNQKNPPKFFLFIKMKDKSIKYFAIQGDQIDDGNGNCLHSKDNEAFFENLWKSLLE